jgi:hypothetical protein
MSKKIFWEYEDQLPELSDSEYNSMFPESKVIDSARMFPYVLVDGKRKYLKLELPDNVDINIYSADRLINGESE